MWPPNRMKSLSLLVMATLLLSTYTHAKEDAVASKQPEICAGDPWPQVVLTPGGINPEGDEFHRVLLRFKEEQDPVREAIAADDADGKSNIKQRVKWLNSKAVDGWLPQGLLPPILEKLSQFDTAVQLTLRWHYGGHTRILILDLESQHHMEKVYGSLQEEEGTLLDLLMEDDQTSASSQGGSKLPNDPLISRQWPLFATNTIGKEGQSGAWDYTKGDKGIVVAVIDTGVDYKHPDLKDSMWVNEGEIPDDGIDNDKNGYVDDVYGMNAVEGANNDTAGDPMDDDMHGTHCAGIIAAQADNGEGIAGIAPGVSIMAVKALGHAGGTYSALVMAFEYALMMKAHVISLSLGGGGGAGVCGIMLRAAEDEGVLAVAASGNDRNDNDVTPNWPANGNQSTTISVGSINAMGCIDGMSNYGIKTVDLVAPGAVVLSTMPVSTDTYYTGGTNSSQPYNFASGTSMACPYVSGAAALVLSYWKETGQEFKGRGAEVKKLLMEGVRQDERFKGFVVTGGALDAAKTLELAKAQAKPKEEEQDSKRTDRVQTRQDKPVRDSAKVQYRKDSHAPSRDAPPRAAPTHVYSRRSADWASHTRDHSRSSQDRLPSTHNDPSQFKRADRPHSTYDGSLLPASDRVPSAHSASDGRDTWRTGDVQGVPRQHDEGWVRSASQRMYSRDRAARIDDASSFALEGNNDERVYSQQRYEPCGPVECCQGYDVYGSPLYCFSHKDGGGLCETRDGCDITYGLDCTVTAAGQCRA